MMPPLPASIEEMKAREN